MNGREEPTLRRLSVLRSAALEVAHELKNHLSVAIGSSELLLSSPASEKQQRDITRTLTALERMNSLITLGQRVLRGGSGSRSAVDLEQILRELLDDMAPLLEHSGRQLRLVREKEIPPVCCHRDDVLGFVTTVLAGNGGAAWTARTETTVTLQSLRMRDDDVLADGEYVGLLIRDQSAVPESLPEDTHHWSLVGEILVFRSAGGDLRTTDDGLLLILPRA